jgi:hypothetical protein
MIPSDLGRVWTSDVRPAHKVKQNIMGETSFWANLNIETSLCPLLDVMVDDRLALSLFPRTRLVV